MTDEKIQGWAIDRDYLSDGPTEPSRVGYGMADSDAVLDDYARLLPRQVTMETGLKAADIDDPIRWLSVQDGESCYGGAVSREWFDSNDDLAYHIQTFIDADIGGGDILFRAQDLEDEFVEKHRSFGCVIKRNGKEWVIVYG